MMKRASMTSVVSGIFAASAALIGAQAQAQTPSAPRAQTQAQAPVADPSATFAQLDANKDAAIDKKEAGRLAGLMAVFDKADTNHDGKLDKTEFQAAMLMMK